MSFEDLIYLATGTQSPSREKFKQGHSELAGEVRLDREVSPNRERVYHEVNGMAPSAQKPGTRRYSPPSSPEGVTFDTYCHVKSNPNPNHIPATDVGPDDDISYSDRYPTWWGDTVDSPRGGEGLGWAVPAHWEVRKIPM